MQIKLFLELEFIMPSKLVLQLLVLFIVSQALGLYVASGLIASNVKATIYSENPEDVSNAFAMFFYILFFTAIMLFVLFVLRIRKSIFLFEALAIFATSMIVFSVLAGNAAFVYAFLLVALRYFFRENILFKNIAAIIAICGAGSLLGVSLAPLPAAVFLALLACYDVIAVFYTKHMVKLAKEISKRQAAFTVSMPTKKHVFQLGTGDLVMPLFFASSVLKKASMHYESLALLPALVLLLGAFTGLVITLDYCARKPRALPALPLQALFMLLAWLAMILGGIEVI